MFNSIVSLGLVGLASAVPLTSRQVVPHYPPTSLSTGFRLVANVTDPATDFTPSVNNWVFEGIHVGAGLEDATLQAASSESLGQIFYENGTAEEIRYNGGNTLTDGGTPLYPYGIGVAAQSAVDAEGLNDVSINIGQGSPNVQLAQFPNVYPILVAGAQGTFIACNQLELYYNKNYTTVRFSYAIFDETTALYENVVPEGCTAINLIPECAILPDLPAGSVASHEFANTVNCYDDVSSIVWSQYGP